MEIQNPKSEVRNYFRTWWTIMLRPIFFYSRLKGDDWKSGALTFLILTAWILAFGASLIVFTVQYLPIGRTLVENISGVQFLIILPVLLTLAAVFFLITFLILGGLFTAAFFVMFYLAAFVLHWTYALLGGQGSFNQKVQNIFYSSAVMLLALFIFCLVILTKYTGLSFQLFRAGFNVVYYLLCLYVYGLWAISGRKNYGVSKWRAFVGAAVPLVILLIIGLLFDKIALSKLEAWVS
ncbi:hypothetical protein COT42_08285 [Candidatus Saganbacteria bacterium CG08_land_8_20_14_0_20_45_16]|uniref:Yip1 domain-containing protein n=1 Tax=Candidatus Saganbacteria bacterium CG08_land_8_20_14_0_20_45_16 TaxID=2014293 RepID=A0A2H0XW24_UNCSA|nr:MAG: hypothetical protein COT42_08285 [Candidatus Saganbacteria bacterium CG08_land_8_20_14_0_20_45_16]